MKPRVVIVADVVGWAWDRKAQQLKRYLGDEFDVTIWYFVKQNNPPKGFDLYFTFDFNYVDHVCGPLIATGITAHVWPTWGEAKVRAWALRAAALHANSAMLLEEIRPFHDRVFYTPNGVDPVQFHRTRPRPLRDRLVVGHVGKPNPRKGAAIVEAACALAGVELRRIDRRYTDALDADQMREFYQDLHVLAVASDMDGTPNPALEAAACEVAVLSNRIGNMPEFIRTGQNGFLVERSAEALADKLVWMRENLPSVVEMGVEARCEIERAWTWEIMAENYRRMWREVLA